MHEFYFYIAKDKIGEAELENGACNSEHLLKAKIDLKDIENSQKLINTLNDKLSLMIDIYEDEKIDSSLIHKAIRITETILQEEKDFEKAQSFSKFLYVLRTAQAYNSSLLIWW